MTNNLFHEITTDVDIDVYNREGILSNLTHVCAKLDNDTTGNDKHRTGVYFQDVPRDPYTNIATVDYKQASKYGYFKVDFLNVNMYEGIKNEDHLTRLLDTQPSWDLFKNKDITDQLFHLHGYSYLLNRFPPKSVEDLAMVLAIIRPSKSHLQHETWAKIKQEVWVKSDEKYQFKRSHAISYALAVVVNLNLLMESISS